MWCFTPVPIYWFHEKVQNGRFLTSIHILWSYSLPLAYFTLKPYANAQVPYCNWLQLMITAASCTFLWSNVTLNYAQYTFALQNNAGSFLELIVCKKYFVGRRQIFEPVHLKTYYSNKITFISPLIKCCFETTEVFKEIEKGKLLIQLLSLQIQQHINNRIAQHIIFSYYCFKCNL